ncbi:glycosyltransferase [Desulfotomaculum copahuensis]|uniref:Glycosyltransferase 2-like domain-containing protein n=1 Tax=Desulfotomaculum copahuensis TaxID=1838280 RepID=A0A1B7LI24_9FIRM|nr:glycosyltransferase [Desulfotomaculum copahuensis]OAT86069.1 hypothetical protein A6M21_16980 [Desulfotomaculum copahuensis]
MRENRAVRALQKTIAVFRRDGWRVVWGKLLIRLRLWMAQSSWGRLFKTAVPPVVKEWLRRRLDPVMPLIGREPLPAGAPLAAVIIPCYNYGKFLPEAVESVRRQTLGGVEVIVVDDGSDDPQTVEVLDQMAADGDVRVIRQPNRGLPAARNAGIAATAARYICCLDADDMLAPTYLEKAVMVLESRPDTGLAYPLARLFGDVDEIWYTEPLNPVKLLQYNHLPVAAVFRRAAWEKAGGYDEEMRLGYEDWDFWLRLAGAGWRGQLIPEPLFLHRRHGRTMTHRAQEKHRQLTAQIRKKHARVAKVKPLRPVGVRPEEAFANLPASRRLPGRHALLVLAPWLNMGGAETVLLQVLAGFAGSGDWDVYVMTTLEAQNEWAGRFLAVTPRVYFLPHLFPRIYFTAAIESMMERHQIDAVLISHSELAYLALPELKGRFAGLPVLDLLHNDSPEGYARLSARRDQYLDGHIAVHEGIKKTMVEELGAAPEKVFVIPNGVDGERFRPPEAGVTEDGCAPAGGGAEEGSRAVYKKEQGLDPARRQVAFAGRLSAEKNPLLFIQAAAALKDLAGVDWLCYGDGPLAEGMRKAAKTAGSPVKFMGACADTAALFKAVDLLVLTSDSEGLPMVVVEALMSGVPVVATNVGCLNQVIEDGVNGRLVEKGDLDGLCRALRLLLAEPAKLPEMGARCRDGVLERFSGARMAAEYVRLFESFLRRKCEARPVPAGGDYDVGNFSAKG